MKFANATNLNRKSGVAQRRDLQFRFRAQRKCRGRIASGFRFSINANCRSLRSGRDDKFEGGGPPWHGWRWMDRVNPRGSPDLPRLPTHALDQLPTKRLIWTRMTLSRPYGIQVKEVVLTQTLKAIGS
jgi:hypothetical protein